MLFIKFTLKFMITYIIFIVFIFSYFKSFYIINRVLKKLRN